MIRNQLIVLVVTFLSLWGGIMFGALLVHLALWLTDPESEPLPKDEEPKP